MEVWNGKLPDWSLVVGLGYVIVELLIPTTFVFVVALGISPVEPTTSDASKVLVVKLNLKVPVVDIRYK